MAKAIFSGLSSGAAMALVLHVFVLAFSETASAGGMSLRQSVPLWPLNSWAPIGGPLAFDRALTGALWGMVLAALIVSGRLPYRMTGFLFGAVICTGFGISVIIDPLGYFTGSFGSGFTGWGLYIGSLWPQALLNGVWGFGTAVMMLTIDAFTPAVRR